MKIAPHVFIFINGIKTDPGQSDGWTDRAVTWINCRLPFAKGEKFEYATAAITRRFRQDARAQAISKMIGFYQRTGFEVTLVGHSNGCDIIARVLDTVATVRSVHLFAPAASEGDFENAIREDKVGKVFIYGSTKDSALHFARISGKLLGIFGLGYGHLGLSGPAFAERFPGQVTAHNDDTHGHSTWFERGENFETTMARIIDNEFGQPPSA